MDSTLMTFGKPGRDLKRKIAATGFICRVVFFLIFNPIFLIRARFYPSAWSRRKQKAVRLMRRFFPFDIKGYEAMPTSHGKVFIINHPTLNDPLCAIIYALYQNPDSEIIVPVNLPWYESICVYREKLRKIGVNIVPILTPETAKRLDGDLGNDEISKVQAGLMKNYITEFVQTLSRGGLAVVAQQATRRRYLFKDKAQSETGDDILSTISLILVGIKKAGIMEQALFVPVGVVPHSIDAKPKLNPFKKYTLNIGEPILAKDLASIKNAAKRPADLHMLQKLTKLLPTVYHYENGGIK